MEKVKTIFYLFDRDNGEYWVNDKRCTELFTLNGFLYEPNGNIIKDIVNPSTNFIKSLSVTTVNDRFTEKSIERRIVLYKSE